MKFALLLDFDGTLADSLPAMNRAYFSFLSKYGKSGSQQEFDELNGPTLPEVVAILKKRYQIDREVKELTSDYFDLVKSELRKVQPMPGAESLLKEANRRKWTVAIVTANWSEIVEDWIQHHGLKPWISQVIGGESVKRGKPHPGIYLSALKQLHVSEAQVFAVEDSYNGLLAALSANLAVMRFGKKQEPRFGNLPFVEGLDQLIPYLEPDFASRFPECTWLPLSNVKVVKDTNSPVTPASGKGGDVDEEEIESVWAEEIKKRPGLFNGPVLALSYLTGDSVSISVTDYRHWLALKPTLVAVSGMLRTDTEIVFGKRSGTVKSHPHCWELVPSGGLTPDSTDSESFSYSTQLLSELKEEAGIPAQSVKSVRLLGFVFSRKEKLLDLAAELTVDQADLSLPRTNEYETLEKVDQTQLGAFLKAKKVVPTSLAILEMSGLL